MKFRLTIILVLSIVTLNLAVAQDSRTIAVTGSAETSVKPDIIYLEITLQEYGEDLNKVPIDSIERGFYRTLEKHCIGKMNVSFSGSQYSWYSSWSRRNESYKSKNLTLKLDSNTRLNDFVKDLSKEGVATLHISRKTNVRIQELRKEVKIAAIKAAKKKATYLVESLDEKLGRVITIVEVNSSAYSPWYNSNFAIGNSTVNSGSRTGEIDNTAEIKLRYEVNVVFEISN